MARTARDPYLKVPKKLVFAAIPLLALGLLAEGVTRVAEWRTARKRAERQTVHYSVELLTHDGVRVSERPGTIELVLDPVRFYRLRPSVARPELRTNALGLRGPETTREKPAGTFRIVLLGGSVAYGWGAPREEDCPAPLLQAALAGERPVEVLNAGVPAYTATQEFCYLATELLDFEPDLVVSLTGFNDLTAAWNVRSGGVTELFPQLEQRLLEAGSPTQVLLEQSALGRRLKRKLSRAGEGAAGPAPEAFPPEARRAFHRAVDGMAALAPGRLLVALQPIYPAHDPSQRPPAEVAALERFLDPDSGRRASYRAFVSSALTAQREELRALEARGPGTRAVDLSACMEGVAEPVFTDLCHFARPGNEVVAARLAEAVRRHPAWTDWKP